MEERRGECGPGLYKSGECDSGWEERRKECRSGKVESSVRKKGENVAGKKREKEADGWISSIWRGEGVRQRERERERERTLHYHFVTCTEKNDGLVIILVFLPPETNYLPVVEISGEVLDYVFSHELWIIFILSSYLRREKKNQSYYESYDVLTT